MFTDVFKRLFTFELPERYKSEYSFHLRAINAGRLLVFSIFSIIVQLVQLIIAAADDGLIEIFTQGLRQTQLVKLVLLLFFASYVSYALSKQRPSGNHIGLVNFYFVAAYSFLQLIIVRFEMIEYSAIYAFSYGAILIGVAPIFDLFESATIIIVYMLAMAAIVISSSLGEPALLPNTMFICGFSLMALISSRLIYVSHTRSFVSERLIFEKKNEIEQVAGELAILSNTDQLTGINNRRGFEAALAVFWRQSIEEKKQIAILMADLDKFKLYNDHYGHVKGDECLKSVANVMRMCFQRKNDLVGRYGGEEFIAAIAFSDSARSIKQSERFRRKVEEQRILHEYSPASSYVTVSVGVAFYIPSEGDLPADLIDKADKALYHAKRTGSNRVVCYDDLPKKVQEK